MQFIQPRLTHLLCVALLSGFVHTACAADLSRRSDLGRADIDLAPAKSWSSSFDDAMVSVQAGADHADENARGAGGNQAYITQIGERNTVHLVQSGTENGAITLQTGDQNEIELSQSGRGNHAAIFQAGYAKASVTQIGNANNATVVQPANASKLSVWQNGDKTSFKLIQY